MKIAQTDIFSYSLPLVRPLLLKNQRLTERTGLLIRLTSDTGSIGWGEGAPLPGFSIETYTEAQEQLIRVARWLESQLLPPQLEHLSGAFHNWLESHTLVPSVACAVEMAALNLLAADQSTPMARLVSDHSVQTVHINGLVANHENITETVRGLRRDGYRAVKLKVGQESIERDVERTRDAFHELGSNTTLRLDANCAWLYDEAVSFAEETTDCEIEYIEEPLADATRLEEFNSRTGCPVALDESLVEMTPEQLAQTRFVTAVVLKPTLLGGFENAAAYARIAKEQDQKVVISSSFESSIGIAALAQLAAAFCTFNTPAGLDTLDWFPNNLTSEPVDRSHGRMRVGQLARVAKSVDVSMLTEVGRD